MFGLPPRLDLGGRFYTKEVFHGGFEDHQEGGTKFLRVRR